MKKKRISTPVRVISDLVYCVDLAIDGPDDPGLVDDGPGTTVWFPVMRPIDLTNSHGFDVTAGRLAEMAAVYDPAIEAASMNFDHAFGGPSLGWCQQLEVRDDGYLWALYDDLAEIALEAIKTKRYPRRSAEFVVVHAATGGGWYFTGLALIGNARPAIPGMPPVQLFRPCYVVNLKEEKTMPQKKKPAAPPAAPPTPPVVEPEETEPEEEVEEEPSSAEIPTPVELQELRNGLALVTQLRAENAKLQSKTFFDGLGAKCTPAVRRIGEPLLTQLLSAGQPVTVKLTAADGKTVEKTVAVALQDLLKALPEFAALGLGPVAEEDPPALTDPSGRLSDERLQQLERKFKFTGSQGFRNN